METTENQQVKQQSKSITTSGSLINWAMSNNQSLPVVGKGATECMWSDRHAYEVLEVSKDGKTVIIDQYNPKRVDNLGMSDCQAYEYKELQGNPRTVVWFRGKWRFLGSEIVYTDAFKKEHAEDTWFLSKSLTPEQKLAVYGGEPMPQNVVEGITRKKVVRHPVNIIWGLLDEHYDFSF